MRIIFDGANTVELYLAGNPEKMEQITTAELAGVSLERTSSAQEFADKLIDIAFWIYANQVRFPDDDVDCWVEFNTKEM